MSPEAQIFNFDENSLFFPLAAYPFGMTYKKPLPSILYKFYHFTLSSVINFELIWGCGMRKKLNFILLYVEIPLSHHYLLKRAISNPKG